MGESGLCMCTMTNDDKDSIDWKSAYERYLHSFCIALCVIIWHSVFYASDIRL